MWKHENIEMKSLNVLPPFFDHGLSGKKLTYNEDWIYSYIASKDEGFLRQLFENGKKERSAVFSIM